MSTPGRLANTGMQRSALRAAADAERSGKDLTRSDGGGFECLT